MENTNLSFSELTYLNAEKFVDQGGFLQNKEELPGGRKVNISKLGNLLLENAFAFLYTKGYVDLRLDSKKVLGIFPQKIVLASKKSAAPEEFILEKDLFSLSDNVNVYLLVYRLIGDDMTVPWSAITYRVKESLVKKGILVKEEIIKKIIVEFKSYKYHLSSQFTGGLNAEMDNMERILADFRRNDFYTTLIKAIESGMKARVEKPDNDSD